MRDELLNVEVFTCQEETPVLAADWRGDYNANHPHSAFGMTSPAQTSRMIRLLALKEAILAEDRAAARRSKTTLSLRPRPELSDQFKVK